MPLKVVTHSAGDTHFRAALMDLIDPVKDGIKITTGSFASPLAIAVSQASERHGVFHWETTGAAEIITRRGFKHTFQVGDFPAGGTIRRTIPALPRQCIHASSAHRAR